MKKWLGSFLWLAAALSVHSGPEQVRIFISEAAKPATEEAFWVGQKVPVIVEVLSETHFSGSTRFSLPDIPGAVFYKPEERAVVMSRKIDGTTFSVQRHEFAFYPQRAGAFAIPPFGVRFGIAGGPGEAVIDSKAKTQALTVRAVLPKGAENLPSLISATDLKVSESWSPNPATLDGPLTAGNAIKRRITFRASDIPGMAFPEIRIPEAEGLKIYRSRAEVNDKMNRGSLIGERVDSLTYVCQESGVYQLPEIIITWWNLDQQQLETVTLPGVTFEVIASPQQTEGNKSQEPQSSKPWRWVVLCGIILTMASGLIYWFKDDYLQKWQGWRHRQRECEASYFKRITPDLAPSEMLNAIQQWYEKIPSSSSDRSFRDFVQDQNGPELQEEWKALQSAVVAPTPEWNGDRLILILKRTRKQINRKGMLIANNGKILTLNELNPK